MRIRTSDMLQSSSGLSAPSRKALPECFQVLDIAPSRKQRPATHSRNKKNHARALMPRRTLVKERREGAVGGPLPRWRGVWGVV